MSIYDYEVELGSLILEGFNSEEYHAHTVTVSSDA